MENFVQFLTNAAPLLLLISILVLGMMLFLERKKSERLEQERKAVFLLIWRANQILAEKDKVMVFLNLEDTAKPLLTIAQCLDENCYQHREHVYAHYVNGEPKLIG